MYYLCCTRKVWNKLDNMNEQLAIKRSMQLMSLFGTTSSKDLLNDAEPDVRIILPITESLSS